MKLSGAHHQDSTFDLTPMIDVVLLLIIFFMVSSRFANTTLTQRDIPDEVGAATDDATWKLVIELDRDGVMTLGGAAITDEDLAQRVRELPKPDEGAASGVVIHADRACSARHLNRIARMLTSSGVRDWAFTTQPESGPPTGESR